ncbi:hypothetical protein D3C87_1524260 [compost metagenome]
MQFVFLCEADSSEHLVRDRTGLPRRFTRSNLRAGGGNVSREGLAYPIQPFIDRFAASFCCRTRGGRLRSEKGNVLLHRLEFADRPAELDAKVGVFNGKRKRPFDCSGHQRAAQDS